MKKLLALLVLGALMIPVAVLAQSNNNVMPYVFLEVLGPYEEDPTDPGPVPAEACVHPLPTEYPWTLTCYAPRMPYNFYIVPIHISHLTEPICTAVPPGAPQCNGLGGFLGCFFGIATSGSGTFTFMSWNACPGFLKGPSTAGEPAACGASSTALCHDWRDHEGYLVYMNMSTTNTTARYLTLTTNADLGHTRVINCVNQYDMNTVYTTPGVQIGGTQTIVCPEWNELDPTPVEETTWGAIKGLYR